GGRFGRCLEERPEIHDEDGGGRPGDGALPVVAARKSVTHGGEGRREDRAEREADQDHAERAAEELSAAREELLSAASVLLLEPYCIADGALADQQEEQRARCSPGQSGDHPSADEAAQHGLSSPMTQ